MLSETCVPHPLPPSAASTADDQALIRRVAARDPHAFEEFYQRHARRPGPAPPSAATRRSRLDPSPCTSPHSPPPPPPGLGSP